MTCITATGSPSVIHQNREIVPVVERGGAMKNWAKENQRERRMYVIPMEDREVSHERVASYLQEGQNFRDVIDSHIDATEKTIKAQRAEFSLLLNHLAKDVAAVKKDFSAKMRIVADLKALLQDHSVKHLIDEHLKAVVKVDRYATALQERFQALVDVVGGYQQDFLAQSETLSKTTERFETLATTLDQQTASRIQTLEGHLEGRAQQLQAAIDTLDGAIGGRVEDALVDLQDAARAQEARLDALSGNIDSLVARMDEHSDVDSELVDFGARLEALRVELDLRLGRVEEATTVAGNHYDEQHQALRQDLLTEVEILSDTVEHRLEALEEVIDARLQSRLERAERLAETGEARLGAALGLWESEQTSIQSRLDGCLARLSSLEQENRELRRVLRSTVLPSSPAEERVVGLETIVEEQAQLIRDLARDRDWLQVKLYAIEDRLKPTKGWLGRLFSRP